MFVLAGSLVWLGLVAGWPQWWWSLAVVALVGIGVAVGVLVRRGPADPLRRVVSAMITVGVLVTPAAVIAVTGVTAFESSEVDDATAQVSATGGDILCRIVARGGDGARDRAYAAATGDLADRLRSGSEALAADTTVSTCTPVQTGVTSVSRHSAEVVVSVNVTERDGTDVVSVGRVLGGRLERVDGRWLAASLEVLR